MIDIKHSIINYVLLFKLNDFVCLILNSLIYIILNSLIAFI